MPTKVIAKQGINSSEPSPLLCSTSPEPNHTLEKSLSKVASKVDNKSVKSGPSTPVQSIVQNDSSSTRNRVASSSSPQNFTCTFKSTIISGSKVAGSIRTNTQSKSVSRAKRLVLETMKTLKVRGESSNRLVYQHCEDWLKDTFDLVEGSFVEKRVFFQMYFDSVRDATSDGEINMQPLACSVVGKYLKAFNPNLVVRKTGKNRTPVYFYGGLKIKEGIAELSDNTSGYASPVRQPNPSSTRQSQRPRKPVKLDDETESECESPIQRRPKIPSPIKIVPSSTSSVKIPTPSSSFSATSSSFSATSSSSTSISTTSLAQKQQVQIDYPLSPVSNTTSPSSTPIYIIFRPIRLMHVAVYNRQDCIQFLGEYLNVVNTWSELLSQPDLIFDKCIETVRQTYQLLRVLENKKEETQFPLFKEKELQRVIVEWQRSVHRVILDRFAPSPLENLTPTELNHRKQFLADYQRFYLRVIAPSTENQTLTLKALSSAAHEEQVAFFRYWQRRIQISNDLIELRTQLRKSTHRVELLAIWNKLTLHDLNFHSIRDLVDPLFDHLFAKFIEFTQKLLSGSLSIHTWYQSIQSSADTYLKSVVARNGFDATTILTGELSTKLIILSESVVLTLDPTNNEVLASSAQLVKIFTDVFSQQLELMSFISEPDSSTSMNDCRLCTFNNLTFYYTPEAASEDSDYRAFVNEYNNQIPKCSFMKRAYRVVMYDSINDDHEDEVMVDVSDYNLNGTTIWSRSVVSELSGSKRKRQCDVEDYLTDDNRIESKSPVKRIKVDFEEEETVFL
ncbi:hypothetical protein BKA69DRAFT_1056623 [Paraphysoderma sedebokerense]|nr:hypothetical protein BKA69DRAFT_1056623 [Paraphysoderma sedebokerense]